MRSANGDAEVFVLSGCPEWKTWFDSIYLLLLLLLLLVTFYQFELLFLNSFYFFLSTF